MPGIAAVERGAAAAAAILTAHREANGGAYPETVAINLWCALGLCVACVACAVGGRTLLGENDPF